MWRQPAYEKEKLPITVQINHAVDNGKENDSRTTEKSTNTLDRNMGAKLLRRKKKMTL